MPRRSRRKGSQKSATVTPKKKGKFTIDNVNFFGSMRDLNKWVKLQEKEKELKEKADDLRQFAKAYHGLSFSAEATLELMLKRCKISGVVVPPEFGGPPEVLVLPPPKPKNALMAPNAPSPGGFEGLFHASTSDDGSSGKSEEPVVPEAIRKLRDSTNGNFTTDGIHFFPTIKQLNKWTETKGIVDIKEAMEIARTPVSCWKSAQSSREQSGFPAQPKSESRQPPGKSQSPNSLSSEKSYRQNRSRHDLITPILRDVQSASVGDWRLWDGLEEAHEEGHAAVQKLFKLHGDFSSLKIVNLSCCGLDHRDLGGLSHILSLKQSGILQIDLSYNSLTGATGQEYVGFERFASAIADKKCRLRALNLRGNKLYCEGARALAIALEQNCNLTELDISETLLSQHMESHAVDFSGLMRIAKALPRNTHLFHLNMETVYTEPETALEFGKALTSTHTLKTFCGMPVRDVLQNKVRKLKVSTCTGNIGAFVASEMVMRTSVFGTGAHPCRLDTLRLCELHMCDKLVDELAKGLRRHRGLKLLDLDAQEKSLRGDAYGDILLNPKRIAMIAEALKENSSLTELRVCNNEFGDEGVITIAELIDAKMGKSCSDRLVNEPQLVSLQLENNEISCNGAMRIAETLHINRVLTHLNLSSNPIANRGAFSKLLKHLQFKSSLVSLNLSNTLFSHRDRQVEDDEKAAEEARNNNFAKLLEDKATIEATKEGKLVLLHELENEIQSLKDEIIRIKSSARPNRGVRMRNEKIRDREKQCRQLATELDELEPKLLHTLEKILIAEEEQRELEAAVHAAENGSSAEEESEDESVISEIYSEVDSILGPIKKRPPIIGFVPAEYKIRSLEGDSMYTGQQSLSDSSSESDGSEDGDDESIALKTTAGERQDAALALSVFLFENGEGGTLTDLDISNNNLGDENLALVVESLRTNATLTSLKMGGNNLTSDGIAFPLLRNVLGQRTALEHISLCGDNIGDAGAKIFAKFIGGNNGKLKSLDLTNTGIGYEGAMKIFDGLASSKYLRRLVLKDNKKITFGANYLQKNMQTILKNDTLMLLDIQNCGIASPVVNVIKVYLLERRGKIALQVRGYGLEKAYKRRPSARKLQAKKLRCMYCQTYKGLSGYTRTKLSKLEFEDIEEMMEQSMDNKLVCLECNRKRDREKKRAFRPKKKYTIKLGSSSGGTVINHLSVITRMYRPEECGTYDL
eukprot:g7536.t1